jgi:polyisoprenoid-binding protein YceI
MKWQLDPSHTSVQASARHMMVTTVRGRFSGTTGDIDYDPAEPERASVRLAIPAANVDTGDEKRDAHLRSADFLDAERYPEIRFESRTVSRSGEGFQVTGDLTIKDVTKPVTVTVSPTAVIQDPWGGTRVGFEAKARIDRREWGLVWNMPAANGVLVSNEVAFAFDLEAVQAPAVAKAA